MPVESKTMDGSVQELVIDDTVNAQIIHVDLYDAVYSRGDEFYSKDSKWDIKKHKEQKEAIRQGRPQKRLEESRLAREIVRAILSTEDNAVRLMGGDKYNQSEFNQEYKNLIIFPDVPDKEVNHMAHTLKGDGLLDYLAVACALGFWVFESEGYHDGTTKRGIHQQKYVPNLELRKTLRTMLLPFETEAHLYTITPSALDDKTFYEKIGNLKNEIKSLREQKNLEEDLMEKIKGKSMAGDRAICRVNICRYALKIEKLQEELKPYEVELQDRQKSKN